MLLAPHFVWTSTFISTGDFASSFWEKMHSILHHHKSSGGSLGFYSCQRQTSLFWNSVESCRKETRRQDVNKIKYILQSMHSICLDKLFSDTPHLRSSTPISYGKSSTTGSEHYFILKRRTSRSGTGLRFRTQNSSRQKHLHLKTSA